MPKPIAVLAPTESLPLYRIDGPGVVEEVGDATVNGEVGEGCGKAEVLTARSTFHPRTPIAPTVDFAVNVVVAVAHDKLAVPEVDAYVKTMPGSTSDKQFPTACPTSPPSR